MRPNVICKQKFFHPGPTVVIGSHPAAWLIRIGIQKTQDGAPQFGGISLQIIKEINAKPVWMNMAFPSRHHGARIRAQEKPSANQIPIDFVDIGHIERFDLVVTHFHRQVRPDALNRITRQKNHL